MLSEWLNGMSTSEIIGQILGIFVIIGCIINAQFPKRWQMLLCQVALNGLSVANYLLLGQGLAVALPCAVAVVHCTVNIVRDQKNKPAPMWENGVFIALYPISWGVGFLISVINGTASPLALLPLVALVFFILSVSAKKEQMMRVFTLCNATMYLIYNIIYMNIAFVAHAFTITSVIIALLRYRTKTDEVKEEINP